MWAGLSYTLDYAEAREAQDEVVNQDGVTVFIDKKAQLSILGTEMDFQESKYCAVLKKDFSYLAHSEGIFPQTGFRICLQQPEYKWDMRLWRVLLCIMEVQ